MSNFVKIPPFTALKQKYIQFTYTILQQIVFIIAAEEESEQPAPQISVSYNFIIELVHTKFRGLC